MCDALQPDAKGRVNSLVTVLLQEVDRFNKLLVVIKVSFIIKILHDSDDYDVDDVRLAVFLFLPHDECASHARSTANSAFYPLWDGK